VHRFANGLATTLPRNEARRWHMLHRKSLVVAIVGSTDENLGAWINEARETLHCHFLVPESAVPSLGSVDPVFYTAVPFLNTLDGSDFFATKDYLQQRWRTCDVAVVDVSNPLVDPFEIVRLQHAAHGYESPVSEIGVVVPALRHGDELIAGYEWDRASEVWATRAVPNVDYGQREIPRYVLTAPSHGLYITSTAIDTVTLRRSDVVGLDFQSQVRRFIALAWKQNVRTLAFAPVVLDVLQLSLPETTDFDREWQTGRRVTDAAGVRKIIYVLPYTSISGGIRTVFEQSDGLRARGFDVEIWTLEDQPTWMKLGFQVKKFSSYGDLLVSLRSEEAITIATWWETAQIVWLASVNVGIPAYYVQEFETWFYPDNPYGRAAVAASYRKEMVQVTIAEYQRTELNDIGSDAIVISSAYDSGNFYERDDVRRDPDTAMAVGRSFFQKNFAMTSAAWLKLGERRPRLQLFGYEPDLLVDERVDYEVRPSDERVNELYNAATVFVQTSRHEGFGLPVIEAMAAGCPVITTDSHGNRDFCHDEVNCLMVEQDDVEGLAAAMRRLLDDPDLQERLRENGRATAADHTWTVVLDKLEALYSKVS
jgi:glycosyltransferase involved in cell wall biosynthesis